jgi:hypothetical protein
MKTKLLLLRAAALLAIITLAGCANMRVGLGGTSDHSPTVTSAPRT